MKMEGAAHMIRPSRSGAWCMSDQAEDPGLLCAQPAFLPHHLRSGGPTGPKVRDIMSLNVIAVSAQSSLRAAVEVMGRCSFTGLPVVDEQSRPVGVLSERDILRWLRRGGRRGYPSSLWDLVLVAHRTPGALPHPDLSERLEQAVVSDLMSTPALTIGPEAPLREALEVMLARGIHRLIVVRDQRVVGIVTRRDLLPSLRPIDH
jgi:CBS domain-containing protein